MKVNDESCKKNGMFYLIMWKYHVKVKKSSEKDHMWKEMFHGGGMNVYDS